MGARGHQAAFVDLSARSRNLEKVKQGAVMVWQSPQVPACRLPGTALWGLGTRPGVAFQEAANRTM